MISFRSLAFITLSCLFSFCTAQEVEIRNLDEWEDVEIVQSHLPIHKMDGKNNFLWATDYGKGKMYKSNDQGNTWKKSQEFTSEYIEQIQFINENIGYLCGDYGYVYKTEDGGANWTEISPNIERRITERYRDDTTKNQKPDGYFVAYYGMHFKNKDEGFLSGYCENPKLGFRESFQRLFYRTSNGGKDWTAVEKSERTEFIDAFISELKPKNIEVNGTYYFDAQTTANTSRNNDGQIVFEKKGPIDTTSSILPDSGYERPMIRNIVFLSELEGLLLGGSLDEGNQKAIIYQTIDGGSTWTYIPSDLPHIHESKMIEGSLWITGKDQLVKKKKITY